jgi:nucleoredoxin
MPWLTLDYNEQDKKEELSTKFEVNGIPTFILLDGDSGEVVCKDARSQVQKKDKKGEDFPWKSSDEKESKKESKDCILM